MDATVDTPTTPAPTTESVPAAPATSAPDSSPAVSERPTNITQLAAHMAKLDASSSATDTTKPPAVPAAAATGQPASQPPASVTPQPKQGPIPFDVHSTALDNARTKAKAEATAEFDRDFGWARQVKPENLASMGRIANEINTNPLAHVEKIIGELQADPHWGPQWRSMAGRLLGGGNVAAASSLEPDVEITNQAGQVVGKAFSAERNVAMINQAVSKAVSDAIGREVQPLKSEYEQRKADEKTRESTRQIEQQADTALARMKDILDGRDDLWGHVDALIAQGTDAIDAALTVRKQHIIPAQTKAAEATAVDTMKRKANANTANGAGTSVAATTRPRNAKELADYMAKLDAGGQR